MAHKINDMINILEKKEAVKCNETCKYWKFPHLDCACILSDVFSVNKNEPCYEYEKKEEL